MKTMRLTLMLAVLLAGCAWLPSPRRAPPAEPPERDVARTEPREGEGPATPIFDEATRRANLAKRFPGSARIDLVRVLHWTEDRAGACWSEAMRPWETGIDARYEIAGDGATKTASGIRELREQGWLGLYRTPNGSGFERRAEFRSMDLTVATEIHCRCSVGTAGAIEEKKLPLRLRFRWQGKGKMPEVSASVERDGRAEGLPGAFAPGHLMSYEFPIQDTFPGGRVGRCGGAIALTILSDPPMQ